MPTNIHTLIPDIYDLLQKEGWFDDARRRQLAEDVSRRIQGSFTRPKEAPTLRLSKMGESCPRALWYSIHESDKGEPLPSPAIIKYSYGHILEALAITFARASGHEVGGEQDEITVDEVVGHRDVVIDGCVVDVKSCSSLSFKKFADGSLAEDDPFGYLEQIDGYVLGSVNDPLVTVKDKGYIWAIDKQLGKMVLYEHKIRTDHIRQRIQDYRSIILLKSPPQCTCKTITDRTTGRLRLDTRASYSNFKHLCFPRLKIELDKGRPKFYVH